MEPTIEELIAKCDGPNGQRLRWITNYKTYWVAQARPIHANPMPKDIKATGKTIREALTNLLELL